MQLSNQIGVRGNDLFRASLERNLNNAQKLADETPDPGPLTQLIAIRGNRKSYEVPLMEAGAHSQYRNALANLAGARSAIDNYDTGLASRDAEIAKTQAETRLADARAKEATFTSDLMSDPNKLVAAMVMKGVDPASAREAALGAGGVQAQQPGQPAPVATAQDLPRRLRSPNTEYLQRYLDPAYKPSATPYDLFDEIVKASPPEASDPGSELGAVILGGLQQRFPNGLGSYPAYPQNSLASKGFPKLGAAVDWATQNVAGPILQGASRMSLVGPSNTWDWKEADRRGRAFQDFINRHNESLRRVGIQGGIK